MARGMFVWGESRVDQRGNRDWAMEERGSSVCGWRWVARAFNGVRERETRGLGCLNSFSRFLSGGGHIRACTLAIIEDSR